MTSNLEKEFGSRLVKFQDGTSGLVRPLELKREAVTVAEGRKIHLFRASDGSVDGDKEIVSPDGWDVKEFKRNPVILDSHNRWTIGSILGSAATVELTAGALMIGVKFSQTNPLGRIAEGLVEEGSLNAGSVGFRPDAWEPGGVAAGYVRRFTKQTLKEFSMVSVPANANALRDGIKSGAVNKADVQELMELLKQFCSDKADAPVDSAARAGALDGAELLQSAWDAAVRLRPN